MQRFHPVAHRDALDLRGLDLPVDAGRKLLAVHHQLVDADATLVAAAAAQMATVWIGFEDLAVPADGLFQELLLPVPGLEGLPAGLADAAQEALGADTHERGGNVERFGAHLGETGDG